MMILINLLPQDYLKTVRLGKKRIPVIPFMILIFLCLILIWLFYVIKISYYKTSITQITHQLQYIEPKKKEVDLIWDELHNNLLLRKKYAEGIIIKQIEWARVLNAISDYTAQSIWLDELILENKDDVWLLTLKGYAKPVTTRSMIKDISKYITQLKNILEALLNDKSALIEEITKTKRKKAGNIELTAFTTVFKIKVNN